MSIIIQTTIILIRKIKDLELAITMIILALMNWKWIEIEKTNLYICKKIIKNKLLKTVCIKAIIKIICIVAYTIVLMI